MKTIIKAKDVQMGEEFESYGGTKGTRVSVVPSCRWPAESVIYRNDAGHISWLHEGSDVTVERCHKASDCTVGCWFKSIVAGSKYMRIADFAHTPNGHLNVLDERYRFTTVDQNIPVVLL